MLRFLRCRRRPPPYGSYLCTAVSCLLLLLSSVSFLYTDLSRSLPHPHLLHEPFREEESPYGPGEIEDKIDGLDIVPEDRGQPREEVDLEEGEVGSGDRIQGTGYFFDQVSGSIRRSFNKRSIEEWEDDRVGFLVGSRVEEDGSRTAFASDDTPVDEEVRRKAAMVVGVEDALLLKMGRRNSPLREGWGDWFDKKGEFLRKNKMFKSNWAVLDPRNNLILQDPDGVGVTKLTEEDREVQNWWMNEFNRTPFLGETTLDIPKVTRDSELQENENEAVNYNADNCSCKSARDLICETKGTECGTLNDNGTVTKMNHGGHKNLRGNDVEAFKSDKETGNDIKGAEHTTLDEDVAFGNIDDVGTLATLIDSVHDSFDESVDDGFAEKDMNAGGDLNSADRNSGTQKYLDGEEHGSGKRQGNNVDHAGVTSEIQRRLESLNHLYADGERWGYYPALPANLTFTEFMDAFFRLGKCDMRVFMVWNSPPWMYGIRHQRGLESLFFHHQDACVVVFSETIELDFFRDNFVNNGYKVAVAMPNLDELLKDTPTHIFASVWFEWRKTKFYSTHYSELIRLAALYKYGGIYLDSDIIVLKPIFSLNNSVGMEDHVGGSALNGAVMAFRRHSLFIEECLKEFHMTYDDTSLRWNGADLLTRVARNFLGDRIQYLNQLELKVEPMNTFFPISSQNITRYFMEPATETEKAQQDLLFDKILLESLTFHFWNSLTSTLIPEPESLVARLINYFCIRCLEFL